MANDDDDVRQSDSDPEESDVSSSEGDDQESLDQSSTDEEILTLDEINKQLGRDFDDKDNALKSLKDTQDYVGDLGSKLSRYESQYGEIEADSQDGQSETSSDTEDDEVMTKSEYRKEQFFAKNEQYANHRDVIEALADKHDASPQEVVEMDEFESLFEASQNQPRQSVAMSSNRVTSDADDDKSHKEKWEEAVGMK
jgi:hypothetical protein